MSTIQVILEVFIFSAVSTIPYYLLILHPFTEKLRFSNKITVLIFITAFLMETVVYFAVRAWDMNIALSYLLHLCILILFSVASIKERMGKIFLTLFILINFYVIINIIASFFEGLIFPDYLAIRYTWAQSLFAAPVMAIFLRFDLHYSIKVYKPTINSLDDNRIWKFIWMLPCTFLVVWYAIMLSAEGSGLEISRDIRFLLVLCLVAAGSFVMDYAIALLISAYADGLTKERELHLLELKQNHFRNMNKRIEDARRARHDLRHHLKVVNLYLEENKLDDLKQYLEQYEANIPRESLAQYSDNHTVNALLNYYEQNCKERGVNFTARIDISQDLTVEEYDLSVIFGNLLENALDACTEVIQQDEEAWLTIESSIKNNMLMISVQNNYKNQINIHSDGHFISTKENGSGIGLGSVKETVNKYNGYMDVKFINEVFRVSVILYQ